MDPSSSTPIGYKSLPSLHSLSEIRSAPLPTSPSLPASVRPSKASLRASRPPQTTAPFSLKYAISPRICLPAIYRATTSLSSANSATAPHSRSPTWANTELNSRSSPTTTRQPPTLSPQRATHWRPKVALTFSHAGQLLPSQASKRPFRPDFSHTTVSRPK